MLSKSIPKSFMFILLLMFTLSVMVQPTHAANEPSISLSKTYVTLHDTIDITINNCSTNGDAWLGLYEEGVTPDGNPTAIWWNYLKDIGISDGNGQYSLDLSSINSDRFMDAGTYQLMVFYDEGYTVDTSVNLLLLDSIETGDTPLNFLAISDVHIGDAIAENKFKNALLKANELVPDLDGVLIAGDFTNNGGSDEYDNFMKVYNQHANEDATKLWVMGNHDYWNWLLPSGAQRRFEEKTGEKIKSHKIIKGYHFIQVSTEGRATHGEFSDTLKIWLRDQLELAKNQDSKKPIFVTVHQHIKDTVYGSDEWGNASLYDVLADYPQVITFSGHSHYAINDERSIHQQDFTSIGTGSLNYMELESGKIQGTTPPGYTDFSQGFLVEVDKETQTVTLKRLDFYNDQFIKDNWVIESPWDSSKYTYTDGRIDESLPPYFDESATLQAHYTHPDALQITFDQAKDEDMVHSYRIQAINQSTGVIDKEFLAFSEFYLYPMPDTLTFDITGLSKSANYEILITAIDSFGIESENPLSTHAKRPQLILSKSSVALNDTVDVTLLNGRITAGPDDWIGLYEENETPDGTPPSIWWAKLPELGIINDSGTFTFDPSMIPEEKKDRYVAGKLYKFIFAYDDTYDIQASATFNTIESQEQK